MGVALGRGTVVGRGVGLGPAVGWMGVAVAPGIGATQGRMASMIRSWALDVMKSTSMDWMLERSTAPMPVKLLNSKSAKNGTLLPITFRVRVAVSVPSLRRMVTGVEVAMPESSKR